jgi:hypothetical protein
LARIGAPADTYRRPSLPLREVCWSVAGAQPCGLCTVCLIEKGNENRSQAKAQKRAPVVGAWLEH